MSRMNRIQGLDERIELASLPGGDWLKATPGMRALRTPRLKASKRLMDITLALVGFVLGPLCWPFIALAVKLDSPGPVFYRQDRVGREGRPYRMIKFRSMVAGAESGEAVWAEENDSRTTAVGRFLRRFHMDEWPQLWNILKGDMSLVGPRPERPEFVRELERNIPHYRDRFAVRPGLTGWAQVRFKYASTVEDARVKLEYDLYYISRWSPSLDIAILARTLLVVARGDVRQ